VKQGSHRGAAPSWSRRWSKPPPRNRLGGIVSARAASAMPTRSASWSGWPTPRLPAVIPRLGPSAKARDAVETAASIVAAHERRTRVLVVEREAAEAALAAHDQAVAQAEHGLRYQLLDQLGAEIDAHLRTVNNLTAAFRDMAAVDPRRREAWTPRWRSRSPAGQLDAALAHFGGVLEPGLATVGQVRAVHEWGFVQYAQDLTMAWQAAQPAVEPQPEAA
jgi:hypothetical protein